MKAIVVVGTAKHINEYDLHKLDGIETVSCNQILLHPYFRPTHLVIADRRAYAPELQSQRLKRWSGKLDIVLSTAIWDRKYKVGGAPVQPRPKFRHREFRLLGSKSPMNVESLGKPFCSCANTGVMLLQFAAVFGAERIGILGVGMVPPRPKQKGHFYGGDGGNKWNGQPSPDRVMDCARRLKTALSARHIQTANLSNNHPEMDEVFGHCGYEPFLAAC